MIYGYIRVSSDKLTVEKQRSYSTFSLAFKQRMDQSVMAWMHDIAG